MRIEQYHCKASHSLSGTAGEIKSSWITVARNCSGGRLHLPILGGVFLVARTSTSTTSASISGGMLIIICLFNGLAVNRSSSMASASPSWFSFPKLCGITAELSRVDAGAVGDGDVLN